MKMETAAVQPLDRTEMMTLLGGEENPGSSLARDLGYLLGYVVGSVQRWFEEMPPASYAYAKTGSY